MWVVPGATQRYIRNKSQGVRDKTLGLILHVQVGNGELTGWFNNPGSGASSAWQAMKSGRVFQFGDPDADKFWTQGAGNPDYGAVESEGYPSEPLTPAQIDGIARIYAEGHKREGWPFQLAERPGDRGLGWHGMGGAAWGGHYDCPGPIRKAQRPQILVRAKQIAGVAPTPSEDDFMDVKNPVTGEPWPAEKALWSIWTYAFNGARDAAVARKLAEAAAKAGKPLTAAQIDDIAAATVAAFSKDYDANVVLTPKES